MPQRRAPLFSASVRRYTARMNARHLLLLALACCFSITAAAQWQWLDQHGRKVFSDRPPPSDVADKNILQRPRGAPAPAAAKSAPDGAAAAVTSAAPAAQAPPSAADSGRDAQLEANKAKAEAAEKAQKQAAEKAQLQKTAQLRADNCRRAQQAKTSLESGRLMSYINAQGERIFMDDAARTAELARTQQAISDNCGPAKSGG